MISAAALRGTGREARWRRRRLRQIAAVCCALLAVWSVWAAVRPAAATGRRVVVAARDLPAGHRVGAADLRTVTWPATVRLPSLADPAPLVGQQVTSAIAAGEPVTRGRLSPRFAASLPADRVGFAVPLDDTGLAGYLREGDLVDLFSPVDHAPTVPAARVMAVSSASPAGGGGATVMVAVPRQNATDLAALLALARSSGGSIVVSLRSAAAQQFGP